MESEDADLRIAAADFSAMVYQMVAQILKRQPRGQPGVIVPGSYDPKDGTVQVLVGTTAAVITTPSDQPLSRPRLPLSTPVYGMQSGPQGGERCTIFPCADGYRVSIDYVEADSPNVPAGETWFIHPDSGSYLKYTNDGATPGDNLGGARFMGFNYHETSTAAGNSMAMNDTAKTVVTQSAGGHATTMDDANRFVKTITSGGHIQIFDDAGRVISTVTSGGLKHIMDDAQTEVSTLASKISLGARFAALADSQAAILKTDIESFKSSIMADMLQSLMKVQSAAMVTAGIPNAPNFSAIVSAAGWVLGHVTPPTVPSGSSVVRMLS